jgi:hypothetical protein
MALEPNVTQLAFAVGERDGFLSEAEFTGPGHNPLMKRGPSFPNPFVEETNHLIFIQAAVLCLEHIHYTPVIPRQVLLE